MHKNELRGARDVRILDGNFKDEKPYKYEVDSRGRVIHNDFYHKGMVNFSVITFIDREGIRRIKHLI